MTTTRHFLTDLDLTSEQQTKVLARAMAMKASPRDYTEELRGKTLAMVFTKSSTRTRVSFEAGMTQLGGHAIFISPQGSQLGRGEPLKDTGAVLSRYCDIIMIRTFAHADVRELAEHSRVPVINGLDDVYHPCQMLADLQTISEQKGGVQGRQLVYVGDGNNVAHSLMLGGAIAGLHVRIISPEGYKPSAEIVEQAKKTAHRTGARIEVTGDLDAVAGADAVYTDVWASMGQEAEAEKRKKAFAGYQVDAKMMKRAKPDAIFLHCLPAHRGEEVAAEVIDGPWSRVYDQAENRLHAQKALMTFLLGN
jgi:ornithine carbamoyltransferase